MAIIRRFTADTEDTLWQQVAEDMRQQGEILTYTAELILQGRSIFLDIDVDLGGGFESGYETTKFLAPLAAHPTLRFHLHPEDWVSEIGKLLGMEDVELGFPRLDKAYIVKTNQPETLKALFANEAIRATLRKFADCDLRIVTHHENGQETTSLSLWYETALTDPATLREIYHVMYTLAEQIENLHNNTQPTISG